MLKVKCVTNLNMLYFAGEEYEITQAEYDANPTCFILLTPGAESNKVMTTADVNIKAEETPAGDETKTKKGKK